MKSSDVLIQSCLIVDIMIRGKPDMRIVLLLSIPPLPLADF